MSIVSRLNEISNQIPQQSLICNKNPAGTTSEAILRIPQMKVCEEFSKPI